MNFLNRFSVRQLIFGNSLLLLLLLALSSGYALFTMQKIGTELEGISKLDIPLTENITSITEHQLQQSVHFERAMRYGEAMERSAANANAKKWFNEEMDAFNALASKVNKEIITAEKLSNLAISNAHNEKEKTEFEHVLSALKMIEKEHKEFDHNSHKTFELLKAHKIIDAEKIAEIVKNEEQQLNRELVDLVHEISDFTKHAAEEAEAHEKQAFSTMITLGTFSLFVGLFFSFLIIRTIWSQIGLEPRELNQIAQRIAHGDLSMNTPDAEREIGIYSAFGLMLGNLKTLIDSIQRGGEQVAASSHELASVTEQTNQNIVSQHQSTDQVAAAITQMSAAVDEVARNTTSAADAALEAKQQMSHSNQLVSETVAGVQSLSHQLDKTVTVIGEVEKGAVEISGILDVIKGIADQTNLLALNAAIEAARAGDQGRGFAVVADEVRSLAQSTQKSASEIEAMISRLQTNANNSVNAMQIGSDQVAQVLSQSEQVTVAIEQAQLTVDQISDMNAQIASAAEQQKAVSADISENATMISTMSKETGEGAKHLTATSEELAQLALQLQENISHFKLIA